MSDPKPVELLTESEKVPLLQAYTEGPIAMLDAVTAIVTTHVAAARREAEDDPKHARMYRALVERAEKAERAVAAARREALLEAADDFANLLHPHEGGVTSWLTARAEEIA